MTTPMKTTIAAALTLTLGTTPMALAVQDAAQPVPGQTVIVALSSGDAIRATLVSETNDSIVLLHPVLGKVTIARTSIASMVATTAPVTVPAPAPVTAPPAAEGVDLDRVRQEAQPAANAAMDAPRKEGEVNPGDNAAVPAAAMKEVSPWKLLFDGNVNFDSAKDKQLDFRIAASAIYEIKDVEKWSNNVEFFFKTVNSATTDDNLLGTSTYNRFVTKGGPWLWFVKGQGQASSLEAWEQRLSLWGGVGYEFMKAPPFRLLGKLGVGGSYEFGDNQNFLPELYGEMEWDWKISESQAVVGSWWVTPDVADFSSYQFLARLEWTMKFQEITGLSILGGIRWQYQSDVPAADVNNDVRIYTGLRYEM